MDNIGARTRSVFPQPTEGAHYMMACSEQGHQALMPLMNKHRFPGTFGGGTYSTLYPWQVTQYMLRVNS